VEDGTGMAGMTAAGARAPWGLGYQMSERNAALWNEGLKARLVQVCVCVREREREIENERERERERERK
jgi:hypothetical protein